jgi:AcrR family transcriptional regulator
VAIKKTAREKKTEETREKITLAMWDLIATYNIDTITVDDICEKAGISKGSFYHLFQSKDDFYILALSRERDRYLKENFTLSSSKPLLTQVIAFVRANLEFNRLKGRKHCVASYISMMKTCRQDWNFKAFYVETLFAFIERGLREGVLDSSLSAEAYFRLFHDWIMGLLIGWSISENPADEDLYDRILERVVRNFFAPSR